MSSMPTALLIIAPCLYQDIELAGVAKALSEAGFEVVLASTEAGECAGKYGGKAVAAVALGDVDVSAYDRIAFIGGPGAEALTVEPEALRIARETVAAGKPLGAICIAPLILSAAGVLQGKKATVWESDHEQAAVLEAAGATFTGETVTVDGKIITGNGPGASEEFGKAFAALP